MVPQVAPVQQGTGLHQHFTRNLRGRNSRTVVAIVKVLMMLHPPTVTIILIMRTIMILHRTKNVRTILEAHLVVVVDHLTSESVVAVVMATIMK